MQEVKYRLDDGQEKILRELFEGNSQTECFDKMRERLAELEKEKMVIEVKRKELTKEEGEKLLLNPRSMITEPEFWQQYEGHFEVKKESK